VIATATKRRGDAGLKALLQVGAASLVASLLCGEARGQVTVSVALSGTTQTHVTSVSNATPTHAVEGFTLALAGTSTWDSFSPGSVTPSVGTTDNNTNQASSIAVAQPVPSGQVFTAGGDIDGAVVSGISATVRWVGGYSAVAQLVKSGSTWSAVLVPPLPVVPVQLTWTPPTLNTDGTPLTDLDSFKIYWGTTQGAYPNVVAVPGSTTMGLVLDETNGLRAGVPTFFVATALNSQAVESAQSNAASKTPVGELAPQPPANLVTVGVERIVYQVFISDDAVSVLPAGTVAEDVPCNANVHVAGYGQPTTDGKTLYMVPVASVTLIPGAFPVAVFAECAGS